MGQRLKAMQAAQEGLQYTTPGQEAFVQLMWLMCKLLGMYSRGHRTKLKSYNVHARGTQGTYGSSTFVMFLT